MAFLQHLILSLTILNYPAGNQENQQEPASTSGMTLSLYHSILFFPWIHFLRDTARIKIN